MGPIMSQLNLFLILVITLFWQCMQGYFPEERGDWWLSTILKYIMREHAQLRPTFITSDLYILEYFQ